MRKLETLKKEVATLTPEKIHELLDNSEMILDEMLQNMSDKDKLTALVYAECKKALVTKTVDVALNCDCEDAKTEEVEINYFKILDAQGRSLARCYIHITKKMVGIDIRFTARKKVLEHEDEIKKLGFNVYRYPELTKDGTPNPRAGKARNCENQNIPYDDFTTTAKAILPLLQKTKVRAKIAESDK